jgi:hypothetical protein
MPIYVHTHAHPHTYTRTEETYKDKPLPPQAPRVKTRPTNPNPHSPHQQTSLLPRVLSPPDLSTSPLLSLSHSSTSLRFSLAPMHSRAHPRSLSNPFTHLRLSLAPKRSQLQLPRTRAPSRCRRSPPNDRNSRTYDWRDAPALGPRDSKLAPFPSEFSELPKEATEWESAPSGYLRSCRSRFFSVFSGDSASSPGFPGEKTVFNRATWAGTFSHLSHTPFRNPSSPCGSVPNRVTWAGTSSCNPLSYREDAQLCNVGGHLFLNSFRGVNVPNCATWAGISSRNPLSCRERARLCNEGRHLLTSLAPLFLVPPDTLGGQPIRRGTDSPPVLGLAPCLASRDPPVPRVPRLTARDFRRALRPVVHAPLGVPYCAPSVIFIPPRPHSPFFSASPI